MGPVHLPGPLRLLDFQETGTLTSQCVLCAQIHRKTNDDFSLLSSSLFKWLCRVLPSSYCTSQDWARKCFKLHRTRADWLSPIVALKLTTRKVRLFYVVNLCTFIRALNLVFVLLHPRWTGRQPSRTFPTDSEHCRVRDAGRCEWSDDSGYCIRCTVFSWASLQCTECVKGRATRRDDCLAQEGA